MAEIQRETTQVLKKILEETYPISDKFKQETYAKIQTLDKYLQTPHVITEIQNIIKWLNEYNFSKAEDYVVAQALIQEVKKNSEFIVYYLCKIPVLKNRIQNLIKSNEYERLNELQKKLKFLIVIGGEFLGAKTTSASIANSSLTYPDFKKAIHIIEDNHYTYYRTNQPYSLSSSITAVACAQRKALLESSPVDLQTQQLLTDLISLYANIAETKENDPHGKAFKILADNNNFNAHSNKFESDYFKFILSTNKSTVEKLNSLISLIDPSTTDENKSSPRITFPKGFITKTNDFLSACIDKNEYHTLMFIAQSLIEICTANDKPQNITDSSITSCFSKIASNIYNALNEKTIPFYICIKLIDIAIITYKHIDSKNISYEDKSKLTSKLIKLYGIKKAQLEKNPTIKNLKIALATIRDINTQEEKITKLISDQLENKFKELETNSSILNEKQLDLKEKTRKLTGIFSQIESTCDSIEKYFKKEIDTFLKEKITILYFHHLLFIKNRTQPENIDFSILVISLIFLNYKDKIIENSEENLPVDLSKEIDKLIEQLKNSDDHEKIKLLINLLKTLAKISKASIRKIYPAIILMDSALLIEQAQETIKDDIRIKLKRDLFKSSLNRPMSKNQPQPSQLVFFKENSILATTYEQLKIRLLLLLDCYIYTNTFSLEDRSLPIDLKNKKYQREANFNYFLKQQFHNITKNQAERSDEDYGLLYLLATHGHIQSIQTIQADLLSENPAVSHDHKQLLKTNYSKVLMAYLFVRLCQKEFKQNTNEQIPNPELDDLVQAGLTRVVTSTFFILDTPSSYKYGHGPVFYNPKTLFAVEEILSGFDTTSGIISPYCYNSDRTMTLELIKENSISLIDQAIFAHTYSIDRTPLPISITTRMKTALNNFENKWKQNINKPDITVEDCLGAAFFYSLANAVTNSDKESTTTIEKTDAFLTAAAKRGSAYALCALANQKHSGFTLKSLNEAITYFERCTPIPQETSRQMYKSKSHLPILPEELLVNIGIDINSLLNQKDSFTLLIAASRLNYAKANLFIFFRLDQIIESIEGYTFAAITDSIFDVPEEEKIIGVQVVEYIKNNYNDLYKLASTNSKDKRLEQLAEIIRETAFTKIINSNFNFYHYLYMNVNNCLTIGFQFLKGPHSFESFKKAILQTHQGYLNTATNQPNPIVTVISDEASVAETKDTNSTISQQQLNKHRFFNSTLITTLTISIDPILINNSADTIKLMPTDNTHYKFDVPGDGSCMLYSIVLAILLPLANDDQETAFYEKSLALFGDNADLGDIFELLKSYDGEKNYIKSSTHGKKLENLIEQNLRDKIKEFALQKHRAEFEDHFKIIQGSGDTVVKNYSFEEYLENYTSKGKAALSDIETTIICKMLGMRITIHKDDGTKPLEFGDHAVEPIHISHANSHYNFYIAKECLSNIPKAGLH